MPGRREAVDQYNWGLYAKGRLSKRFSSLGHWLDEGEQTAVSTVANAVRGSPVLDIGVGAGRTLSLLCLITSNYRAIDYSPALVERCSRAFPGRDVTVGDARDLSRFERDHFGLVLFSYNGLDSVCHEDRQVVLEEVASVLRPGGFFVYSTANKEGPWFMERPWDALHKARLDIATARKALYWLADFSPRWFSQLAAWWRVRKVVDDHGDWALAPIGQHGSGLVMHWTTAPRIGRELMAAGLDLLRLYAPDGQPLAPDGHTHVTMVHVVAAKGGAIVPASRSVSRLSSQTTTRQELIGHSLAGGSAEQTA